MKRVLITGGAGFVGRHFVRHFLEAGDEVVCVDPIVPYTGGIDPQAPWPLFEPRDYKNFQFDKSDCRDFFKRDHSAFDLSVHLAAKVGGRLMIENEPLAVADDLSIDSAYWQWALEAKPKKTLCFSSSAAYPVQFQGLKDYKLLREDMIQFEGGDIGQPDMSYGWAKLTCEYLARLAYQKHGLKSVCYRPFSGYGEDQDDTYPFPSICKRIIAHKGAKTVSVWGTGEQMRDFVHIDDCVRAVIHTMDRYDDASAINLSTGIFTSFKEFARMAAEVAGFRPDIVGMSDKPAGVHARAGDTSLQNQLGVKHQIPFRTGVERALKYFEAGIQKRV
jgi:GDP-L-fucose synthase